MKTPGSARAEDHRFGSARNRRPVVDTSVPAPIELAKQVVLIGMAILFYFAVRGMTEGSVETADANARWVLDLEGRLGLRTEEDLQGWILGSDVRTTLMNWVYIWLHWPLIIISLFWLHHSHRLRYLEVRNAMFISGAIGLVIFALFPVTPPRLLDPHYVDTVTELSHSYRVLQPPNLVNKYAAVPSLHVGWNLLIGIALVKTSSNRIVQAIGVVSPIAMAVAVVATANHYMVDGMLGAILALLGVVISRLVTESIARHDLTRRLDKAEIVDDDTIDVRPVESDDVVDAVDRPGEHSTASPEDRDHPTTQESSVHDRTIDLRWSQQHQQQLRPVAGRANGTNCRRVDERA